MEPLSYLLRTTYWINDYFKGSPIRQHYNDIQVIMTDPVKGAERRNSHLSNLIEHATEHSPFYKQYKNQDVHAFPVVNKSNLIENYDRIKVALDKIPGQNGPIRIQSTSGSTGIPFSVPQDTRKKNRRIAELKYFGELVGFKSHDKLIHLRAWNRWQNKSKLQSLRENIIPFNIEKIDRPHLNELCTIIRQKNITALRGFASSIDLLVNYIKDNDIKLPSLKIIIAGSESLQESTRELVKTYIGCNIISQYANEENGIIAQERVLNNTRTPFILNHASYFFEVLKLEEDKPAKYGELGRIVLTDLFNYAFPMIRYDTGDTGTIQIDAENSNGYSVLSNIYGRKVDLVFNTNGDIVHPTAISRMLKHYSQITQWQFIQDTERSYSLKLIIKNGDFDSHEIRKELFAMFGNNADIKIKCTDEIPILSSGKRKPVINNWKK